MIAPSMVRRTSDQLPLKRAKITNSARAKSLRKTIQRAGILFEMKIAPLLLLAGVLIAGCQSETTTQTAAPNNEASADSNTAKPSGDTAAEIKTGMSMADVKKIKGAPKDTKHDHGPNDSELDFWVYDDHTVKFQDGKVVE